MAMLLITGFNNITITADINPTNGQLRLKYGSTDLPDPNDYTKATHGSDAITFHVPHFSGWTMSVTHPGDSLPVAWSSGSSEAYYTFADPTTAAIEVTFTATDGTQQKTKSVYLDVKPKDDLPDHP
jgi:hypothetical protein